MHDAVAEHCRKHFSFLWIVYDESTWKDGPYIDVKADRRKVPPNYPSDEPRISAHTTSCVYVVPHRNRQRIGRGAVADVSIYNQFLPYISAFYVVRLFIYNKCCTALTEKPLKRLLLFAGLTPVLLKFRL